MLVVHDALQRHRPAAAAASARSATSTASTAASAPSSTWWWPGPRSWACRRWSSPSIPIRWRCCARTRRRRCSPRRPQKETLLEEAGIDVVLVVRFTPSSRGCRRGVFVREFLHEQARTCARSTSARASSSATTARATWRCSRRWAGSFGFDAFGVDEVSPRRRADLQHPHPRAPSREGEVEEAWEMLGRPYCDRRA